MYSSRGWVAHGSGGGTCSCLRWGLRLWTIYVRPVHTAILPSLVCASRRFTPLYPISPDGHQSTDLVLAPPHAGLLVLRSRLQSGGGPSKQARIAIMFCPRN